MCLCPSQFAACASQPSYLYFIQATVLPLSRVYESPKYTLIMRHSRYVCMCACVLVHRTICGTCSMLPVIAACTNTTSAYHKFPPTFLTPRIVCVCVQEYAYSNSTDLFASLRPGLCSNRPVFPLPDLQNSGFKMCACVSSQNCDYKLGTCVSTLTVSKLRSCPT